MKRKTLTLVLCLLATFALASVGFASWILTNPNAAVTGTTTGDFTVYNAVDKSVSVEVEFTNETFVFGSPVDQNEFANPWLTMDGLSTDVLSTTITLTVSNYESLSDAGLTVEIYDVFADSKLKAAIDGEYIQCKSGSFSDTEKTLTLPDESTVKAYTLTKTISKSEITAGSGTVSFNLTFDWGVTFGEENPYNYYNALDYDASASTELNALYDSLNGLKFNLLITQ